MKKIKHNGRLGHSVAAVLSGDKTMMRVPISDKLFDKACAFANTIDGAGLYIYGYLTEYNKYKPGEVVVVEVSYKDLKVALCEYGVLPYVEKALHKTNGDPAEIVSFKILIQSVRIERLQNISDDDCLREGVYMDLRTDGMDVRYKMYKGSSKEYFTPRDAFYALIEEDFGEGTWLKNPYVFVYEFKLLI